MLVNYGHYLLPLAIAKRTGPNEGDLVRFAGSSFYIDSKGTIATCSHIIESLKEDEFLVAKELRTNTFLEVKEVICHKKFDFAVGHVDVTNNEFFKPLDNPLMLGDDVDALGFTANGKVGKDLHIDSRMLRGYVTRLSQSPQLNLRCKSTFEVSFPSLSGFSGAPVTTHKGAFLLGMLYGNMESSIEVFSFTEIKQDDSTISEKICRVLEFGVAHPINDIRFFLQELNIKAFV